MNRVYIKGDYVDYMNECFFFFIENVFVIVKYKEIIKIKINVDRMNCRII